MGKVRNNIRSQMHNKRITQAYMAKKFHVEPRTWRRWMENTDGLELWKLRTIAEILNISVEELIKEDT